MRNTYREEKTKYTEARNNYFFYLQKKGSYLWYNEKQQKINLLNK